MASMYKVRRSAREKETGRESRHSRRPSRYEDDADADAVPKSISRRATEPISGPMVKYVEREPECVSERSEPTIAVTLENMQTTFENMVSVLSKKDSAELSKDSVIRMVQDIYEWIVIDPNRQISIPSASGQKTIDKMWPQGSTIDTRKKRVDSTIEMSSRKLREVDQDCARTVASSVVSSTIEEEGGAIRKGSVIYASGRVHHGPISYTDSMGYETTCYPNAPITYDRPYQNYVPHHQRTTPVFSATRVEQNESHPERPAGRIVPRFSVLGGNVEPPVRLEDTPQMKPAELPKRRVIKKTKVGAMARGNDGDGQEIRWEDE